MSDYPPLTETVAMDPPPSTEETDYLNRSKKNIKSTIAYLTDYVVGEISDYSNIPMEAEPNGENEAPAEQLAGLSSSHNFWAKTFKEAVIRKIPQTHVYFESKDEKAFEEDNLMEKEDGSERGS